jgi:hypothetical protein
MYDPFKVLSEFVCFFFAVLGLEFRASTLSHFTSLFFVMDVLEIHLEIGSCKLFARAGFEL